MSPTEVMTAVQKIMVPRKLTYINFLEMSPTEVMTAVQKIMVPRKLTYINLLEMSHRAVMIPVHYLIIKCYSWYIMSHSLCRIYIHRTSFCCLLKYFKNFNIRYIIAMAFQFHFIFFM